VSADGRHVYVALLEDDAVVIFGRAPSNGSLSFVGAVAYWRDAETGSLGFAQTETDERAARGRSERPDALLAHGRYLYATSLGDEAIATFVPEPAAGAAAGAALLALALRLHRHRIRSR
jgi:hypothetical protein